MNCNQAEQLLAAYLDNEIDAEEKADIEAHLAGCDRCRQELEFITVIQNNFRLKLNTKAEHTSSSTYTLQMLKQHLAKNKSRKLPILSSIKSRIAGWARKFWHRPVWQRAVVGATTVALALALGLGIPFITPQMMRNPLVSADGWALQATTPIQAQDQPQNNSLFDVWGSGPDDVFAVGLNGSILHYDGSDWSRMDVGTMLQRIYSDDVEWNEEITARRGERTDIPLHAVWGSGPNDVFVAQGDDNKSRDVTIDTAILHYDGNEWSQMESRTKDRILDMWGSGPDDVYAVGYKPGFKQIPSAVNPGGIDHIKTKAAAIMHYDGSSWSRVYSSTDGYINSIWGSGPDDIFAAGAARYIVELGVGGGAWFEGCSLLHYDGNEWSQMDTGLDYPLHSVWGSGPNDVYAIAGISMTGEFSSETPLLHYDGSNWSQVEGVPTEHLLSQIWGNGPDDVYVIGGVTRSDDVIIWHYDGSVWSQMDTSDIPRVGIIWSSGPDDLYAVGYGGVIMHYDGNEWILESSVSPLSTQNLRDVWGSAADDVYAVGRGENMMHYDGTEWNLMSSPATQGVTAIWGSSANDVYAAGLAGSDFNNAEAIIMHYDGSVWSVMDTGNLLISPMLMSGIYIDAIWGSDADDIFAVGIYYELIAAGDEYDIHKMEAAILHYDGDAWSQMDTGALPYKLNAVWGSSSNDVFAAGTLVEIDGSGDVQYSTEGAVLHYNGSVWSVMDTGIDMETNDFGSSIWGSSSNDVYVIGHRAIYHYDGNSWSQESVESLVYSIWGDSSSDIYAVGLNGIILHYNGTSWSKLDSPCNKRLAGIWGSSSTDVFAVGDTGTILHYWEDPMMEQ